MMKPRLYVDAHLFKGARIIPSKEQKHYLKHAMRRKKGSELIVFNGQDAEKEWNASLEELHLELTLIIGEPRHILKEPPVHLTLVVAVAKGATMDWIVQKATELGVARLIPIISERTITRMTNQRWQGRIQRWRKISFEATEQCGRARLMEVHDPVVLAELEDHLRPGSRFLFWEEDNEENRLKKFKISENTITLLTGPEGGLSEGEVQWSQQELGFEMVSLGPRILRAETAVVSAVTAVLTLWGDMG